MNIKLKFGKWILTSVVVIVLLLAGCNSTSQQSTTNMINESQNGETDNIVNVEPGIGTLSELPQFKDWFSPSGSVSSEHYSLHVSQNTLTTLGIPNGFSVDQSKLEEMYILSVTYWAYTVYWADKPYTPMNITPTPDPSSFSVYSRVMNEDMELDLEEANSAFNKNSTLGEQSFKYYFNFGPSFNNHLDTCKSKNIEGYVNYIDVYLVNDEKQFHSVFNGLNENNICHTIVYSSPYLYFSGDHLIVVAKGGGLTLNNGQDQDIYNKNIPGYFTSSMTNIISSVADLLGSDWGFTGSVTISDLFDCSQAFCSDPQGTSAFSY